MKALCLLLLIIFPLCTRADSDGRTPYDEEVHYRLDSYIGTLRGWMKEIGLSSAKRLETMSRQLFGLQTAGDLYCKAQQELIAADDSLLQLAVEFNQLLQAVADSIGQQQQRLTSLADFDRAERFILAQDSAYQRLKRNALLLSASPLTAASLDELKTREQLLASDIDSHFLLAQKAALVSPSLKPRMQRMTQRRMAQQKLSQEIQAAAYKPWTERLREQALNIAAVGIVLLLLNVVLTRLQSLKKARQSARKMKELINKTNNDYPQI